MTPKTVEELEQEIAQLREKISVDSAWFVQTHASSEAEIADLKEALEWARQENDELKRLLHMHGVLA